MARHPCTWEWKTGACGHGDRGDGAEAGEAQASDRGLWCRSALPGIPVAHWASARNEG